MEIYVSENIFEDTKSYKNNGDIALIQNRYKVVLFNDSLVGGAGKSILVLAESLVKRSVQVDIIIYERSIDYDVPDTIPVHILENKNTILNKKKSIATALNKKINELGKVDFIMSNSSPSNRILSLLDLDNVYHCVRSAETKKFSGVLKHLREAWRNRKYRKLYSNKNLITVSEGLKELITQHIKATPESMRTIYEPFSFDQINELSKEKIKNIPHEDYIIHVGRFDLVSKRQDILLRAYKRSEIPNKLILLGTGSDEDEIRVLIHELELEDKVILPGFYDNPFPWIQQAKLFVLSSDFEGFGRVLVEALALKTPVVSTDCQSGPREILTGILSKYLVPTGDINALASKIKDALASYPEITHNMVEQFSDDKISQEYIKLIEDGRIDQ